MKLKLLTTAALIGSAGAFSANKQPEVSRRNFFGGAVAAVTGATLLVAPSDANAALGKLPDSAVQREINSFNDLINNFKDTTLNGGLDASKLKEPSVSFLEFGERMKKGGVASVEFMAPNGDVGAGHRRHGIDLVNSKKNKVYVWALGQVNVRLKTTYEEQNSTPD